MLRRIYIYLIQRHPRQFRQRFGEEMLAIFDEPARPGSGLRLVIDAFLSLLRQWILRPEYWLHPEHLAPSGGIMTSLNELHRKSEQLQRKARSVNLVWTLGALPLTVVVSALVNPHTRTVTAEFTYALIPISLFFALYLRFSWGRPQIEGFVSIRADGNRRRRELEIKWESSQMWSAHMGTVLMFALLTFASIPVFFSLLGGKPPIGHSWLFVYLIVSAVQAVLYFAVLKNVNRRATLALEQEIVLVTTRGSSPGLTV